MTTVVVWFAVTAASYYGIAKLKKPLKQGDIDVNVTGKKAVKGKGNGD